MNESPETTGLFVATLNKEICMTTPRPHAELAIKYYSDSYLKCWYWDENTHVWVEINAPAFYEEYVYRVERTRPTGIPHQSELDKARTSEYT